MTEKIQAYMEEHHMTDSGDTILVGVSGGADSVCLLLVLLELQEKLRLTLRVVHVEHGIRGELAKRDAAFVEALCKKKEVSFACYHFDVPKLAKERGASLEEMGRILRYETFAKEAGRYEHCRIAVAHNQNDNAETMLHNLVRGSYAAGMAGIAPVRDGIIRPLLCVTREEIEKYLAKRGQEYCTDETNGELVYTRNRIRHEVLPVLEQINPASVSHMARTAEHLREMQEYIGTQAKLLCQQSVTWQEKTAHIAKEVLQKAPLLLQKQVLYETVTGLAGSKKDITEAHIEALLELLQKQTGRECTLPYGLVAVREYAGLRIGCLKKGQKEEPVIVEEPIFSAGHFTMEMFECAQGKKEFPKKKYTKWLDYDKIKNNLCVRGRQAGDYFMMEDGHAKKLKQYLIDEKIPKEQRNQIPLVADGSHIIWIVGYRISAYYKITEQTQRILKIHYEDGGREEDE